MPSIGCGKPRGADTAPIRCKADRSQGGRQGHGDWRAKAFRDQGDRDRQGRRNADPDRTQEEARPRRASRLSRSKGSDRGGHATWLQGHCRATTETKDEGKMEGKEEGKMEGKREGKADGKMEGKNEGKMEGKGEGKMEGKAEG